MKTLAKYHLYNMITNLSHLTTTINMPVHSLVLECFYEEESLSIVMIVLQDNSQPVIPRTFNCIASNNSSHIFGGSMVYWHIGTVRIPSKDTVGRSEYYSIFESK